MSNMLRPGLFATVVFVSIAAAQTPPTPRPLGRVRATSTEALASVSQVRGLPGGRLIVNDVTGRRVLLFDSTLKVVTVIADSTGTTANAYGSRLGGLIAYRGDSTLFVDPASLSMLMIDANGAIRRTLAAPRPSDIQNLIGGPFGTPGFDSQGRLVYRIGIRAQRRPPPADGSLPTPPPLPDSALVVRVDLASRKLDTVVTFGIPKIRFSLFTIQIGDHTGTGASSVVNPVPWTDDWALLSDGTIAIVRGREYRVDFIDGTDKLTSGPKLPFEWQRLTDDDKRAILDSTRTELEKVVAARLAVRAAAAGTSASSARGASPTVQAAAPPVALVDADEIPDYRPAFRQGAARGDADGNLWIRTSKIVNGAAEYDVIDNKGTLVDRVLVPPGRVIAGFGPGGTVYMGVVDGSITRLERATVH